MKVFLCFIALFYLGYAQPIGTVGSTCMLNGQSLVVDACGVCGGDGSSCVCGNGYLGFSQRDVDIGVLCHTNTQLKSEIGLTKDLLAELAELVEGLDVVKGCPMSKTLGFSDWVEHTVGVLEGNKCPTSVQAFDLLTTGLTDRLEALQL